MRDRTPEALKLFRDVMAASASIIPLVFPPILIQAEAQGRRFQEMHVDGGVTAPVLTLPEALLFQGRLPDNAKMDIYILVNKKIERNFELVANSTIDVASRSLSSITQSQTRSSSRPMISPSATTSASISPTSSAIIQRRRPKASTPAICGRSISTDTRKRRAARPGPRGCRDDTANSARFAMTPRLLRAIEQ